MPNNQGNHDPLADLRLFTLKEVREITGYSANHIYRKMRKGEFPRSIKIGPNSVRWRRKDIEAWLESRAAASGYAPMPQGPSGACAQHDV